jgi:hypothetical protein
MLILECSQGCYAVKIWPVGVHVHGNDWVYYPLANENLAIEVAKGYSNATVRPPHPCKHSRINILQWILTKLGTYLVLKRIWNRSQGCYTLKNLPSDLDLWPWKSIGFPLLLRNKYVPSLVKIHWRMLILECSQGCYVVKIWSGDLES